MGLPVNDVPLELLEEFTLLRVLDSSEASELEVVFEIVTKSP